MQKTKPFAISKESKRNLVNRFYEYQTISSYLDKNIFEQLIHEFISHIASNCSSCDFAFPTWIVYTDKSKPDNVKNNLAELSQEGKMIVFVFILRYSVNNIRYKKCCTYIARRIFDLPLFGGWLG